MDLIDEEELNELSNFLKYHKKSHVTSNDIANRLDISYEDAKAVVKLLLGFDMLEMNFKVYCSNSCEADNDTIYESIEDIPNEICVFCEKGCSILKNIIVIYKVLDWRFYE